MSTSDFATPTALAVAQQYESWPYPDISLFASVRKKDVWQLQMDHLRDRAQVPALKQAPRIWIAGCGTFQPYVFSLANPRAKILATDVSTQSLRVAHRRSRWYGQFSTRFEQVDLNRPDTWPEGEFDFIECYGVLMNLQNPQKTLSALTEKLAPDGVLRLMVYPFFSRQRVFQVQRLAKLLGFSSRNRRHPSQFRTLMSTLPKAHPLRHAFDGYFDARNDAGIVDAFFHAGDRGFTGLELGAMFNAAGLSARFFFHRPWAQPGPMAESLQRAGAPWDAVLHYLDLWQELRGNFIVLATRKNVERSKESPRVHPFLKPWWRNVTGFSADSRTHEEGVAYSPGDVARLKKELASNSSAPLVQRASEDGLVLGLSRTRRFSEACGDDVGAFAPLVLGENVPNPLYSHIFHAYRFTGSPSLSWPDWKAQLELWKDEASPLEDDTVRFGLTPYGTAMAARAEIERFVASPSAAFAANYAEMTFSDDELGMPKALEWVKRVKAPRTDFQTHELRELWRLTGGFETLWVDSHRV